jgi:L-ascorbate metabolism protein UlaG (beta-lactamase superfamily)
MKQRLYADLPNGRWMTLGGLAGFVFSAVCAAAGVQAPGPALDVTYVANEGFLIQAANKKVLVDALFDAGGEYLGPSGETLEQLRGAQGPFAGVDLILVTHRHRDHFNPNMVMAHLRHNPKARLIAHTQVVDQMRNQEGFAQIGERIHEVSLEPGAHERVTVQGMTIDALCLAHLRYSVDGRDVHAQVRNLAFIVDLGGTRFLHLGDATVENSLTHLSAYPFEETPVDIVFLGYPDRSAAAREFIGRRIKPSRIIAMHIPPADLAEELKKVWAAYPFAIVFHKSMEQRSLPIETDFHRLAGDYFGQPAPGATPQVFARGVVSSDLQEHGAPAFSPDGNEVVWSSNRRPGPDNEQWIGAVMTMRRENGRWSAPYVPELDHVLAFSADGRRAYFTVPPAPGGPSVPDISFVEKQSSGWSEPKSLNLVARYSELRFAMGSAVARNGNLYFLAYTPGPLNDYGIYRAELVNGEYAKPELLPRSINLPPFLNWTPLPAPDESYLLFSSNRRDPDHDAGDLYISRRLADGSWTDPVSLGEPVNTDRQERIPVISNDGKYLFFSRQTPDHEEDVFWVDAATIPALRRPMTNLPQENPK